MSPITDDEQVDELKERRRARESRPRSNRDAPPRVPSAEPARDLLGGLITNGSPVGDEDRPPGAQDGADGVPAPAREATSAPDSPGGRAEPAAQVGGEKIDELIRRVKEGTPADADAATTIHQRRPKGTADLPPSPASRSAKRLASVALRVNCQAGRPKRRCSSAPTHSASSVGSIVLVPVRDRSATAAATAGGECPAIAAVSP